MVGGGVPVQDLGLPAVLANDGWGNRFTYFMTENLSDYDEYDPEGTNADGIITIRNGSNAQNGFQTDITTEASFVIISHGTNEARAIGGKGFGTRTGGSANEQENADADDIIILEPLNNWFDDMLSYRTKWQLVD